MFRDGADFVARQTVRLSQALARAVFEFADAAVSADLDSAVIGLAEGPDVVVHKAFVGAESLDTPLSPLGEAIGFVA